ncbi:MAG: hypothetical protein AAFP69_17370 [Planctomycetota bacterium]
MHQRSISAIVDDQRWMLRRIRRRDQCGVTRPGVSNQFIVDAQYGTLRVGQLHNGADKWGANAIAKQ